MKATEHSKVLILTGEFGVPIRIKASAILAVVGEPSGSPSGSKIYIHGHCFHVSASFEKVSELLEAPMEDQA